MLQFVCNLIQEPIKYFNLVSEIIENEIFKFEKFEKEIRLTSLSTLLASYSWSLLLQDESLSVASLVLLCVSRLQSSGPSPLVCGSGSRFTAGIIFSETSVMFSRSLTGPSTKPLYSTL